MHAAVTPCSVPFGPGGRVNFERLPRTMGFQASIILLKRAGIVRDMAGTIWCVTSKTSSYLNRKVLVADCGRWRTVASLYYVGLSRPLGEHSPRQFEVDMRFEHLLIKSCD